MKLTAIYIHVVNREENFIHFDVKFLKLLFYDDSLHVFVTYLDLKNYKSVVSTKKKLLIIVSKTKTK